MCDTLGSLSLAASVLVDAIERLNRFRFER
jgi:hypothetical protein